MFNSPVLDLVILLSFIYFVGSLILSSINEAIAGSLRLRPKQLQTSLENLLFGSSIPKPLVPWKPWVAATLLKSPHIQSLMKDADSYPSYIPAKNFVLAVIGQLGAAKYTPATLQAAITGSALPDEFKTVLTDLAAEAANDLNAFETNLSQFYNNAMDRAGGIYKKDIRRILIILAFAIACFLNLDTIKISQDELANKTKLSQDVDNISKQIPKINIGKDGTETVNIKSDNGVISVNRSLQVMQRDTSKKAGAAKGDTGKSVAANLKTVNQLTLYLGQTSGYTLGYSAAGGVCQQWFGKQGPQGQFNFDISAFLKKLLGILISAFALQLSSSFWFDLMSKAVNIRAAGKKPDAGKKNSQ